MSETPVAIRPRTFDDAESILSANLPSYESRPQQKSLALAVEASLANGHHLVAQAGTGTGKSQAYLIPAILSGKRVLVSTATKALQDQLAEKDLPFLQEHLGVDFDWALLKGRSNYLCLDLYGEARVDENLPDGAAPVIDAAIESGDWDGLRESLTGLDIEPRDWSRLTMSSEECPGVKKCPIGDVCYAHQAKLHAQAADVVVANHALLATELMVREVSDGNGTMLGYFDHVIVDECHELDSYATGAFSERFSRERLEALASDVRVLTGDSEEIGGLQGAKEGLWDVLEEGPITEAVVRDHEDEWVAVVVALVKLANVLDDLDDEDYGDRLNKLRSARNRARSFSETFMSIITAPPLEMVRVVESYEVKRRGRSETRLAINVIPVSVAPILSRLLYQETPVVHVSATVLVNGSSRYVADTLGIGEHLTIDVGTPFDFQSQAMLYVPDIPEPAGDGRAVWETASIEVMAKLVQASQGRALLLFTSKRQMEQAYASLKGRLVGYGYQSFMQGEASPGRLVQAFKDDPSSVLFATKSFFTGVDVQGDALSLLVMDKLPFPRVDDPLAAARCAKIEAAGKRAFDGYTVPEMTLPLQQGFGRLIRHREDRGVVAILDSRLYSKGYGKRILNDLPDATRTRDFADVEEFFDATR